MSKRPEIADTLLIRNEEIPVAIRYLPQADLRFFPDNPRVYTIVRGDGKEPAQDEIQERLLNMEHVRELIQDIKRNGGLIEPLLVRDGTFEVLEGNSRLAAYRFLAKSEPIKWGHVKCVVLPSSVGESQIFAILGQHHIKGKKDWQPYEQAGFVYRRFKYHGTALETLSKEIGLSQKRIQHLIDTYQFMIDHDETEVARWSYYDEYLKSSKIRKARKKYPELDKAVVKKIKSQEISKAVEIRDQLPVICTGPPKGLKRFISGDLGFEDAFEAAEEAGGTNSQLKRLVKFVRWLVKDEVEQGLAASDGQVRSKIEYELRKLNARVITLRKKLKVDNDD
jgi:hypothetical protein